MLIQANKKAENFTFLNELRSRSISASINKFHLLLALPRNTDEGVQQTINGIKIREFHLKKVTFVCLHITTKVVPDLEPKYIFNCRKIPLKPKEVAFCRIG